MNGGTDRQTDVQIDDDNDIDDVTDGSPRSVMSPIVSPGQEVCGGAIQFCVEIK